MGAGGTGGNFLGYIDREAGQPPRRRLKRFRPLRLTLGACWPDAEAGNDKPIMEQPEGVTREDLVDLRCRHTPKAYARCGGGFSPTVSLIT